MRPHLLKQMTWEDVRDIVLVNGALYYGECLAGRDPRDKYPSPEIYYTEILRLLRGQNGVPPPIEGRYPGVLACAEIVCGQPLTDTRERENTLIRSFVAHKLHKDGYSYSEIGKVMHRDHSTITHLVHRMRDMLSLPNAYKWEVQQYKRFEEML